MQPYNPRPSLQPVQRPTNAGGVSYARPQMQVPQRSMNAVDRALMHNFGSSPTLPPSYKHPQPHTPDHTATYASSTQAMFAAPEAPHQTPYQQMYHYDPVRQRKTYHFPFRALMVILVIGAMSFGAYAVYRAFTNPAPANAEFEQYNSDVLAP